jgi:stage II sporulation protein R
MRGRKWFIVALLISALCLVFLLQTSKNSDRTEALLRLHVKANSDAPHDQAVKYQVRDAVLDVLSRHLVAAGNADAAKEKVEAVLPEVLLTAEATLQSAGYDYPVSATLGEAEFPTRLYGDRVYRAGTYQAVQIYLGEGQGENWWCVLFPPLCFVETAPEAAIPVTSGQFSEHPRPKSRIVEWLQRLFTRGA